MFESTVFFTNPTRISQIIANRYDYSLIKMWWNHLPQWPHYFSQIKCLETWNQIYSLSQSKENHGTDKCIKNKQTKKTGFKFVREFEVLFWNLLNINNNLKQNYNKDFRRVGRVCLHICEWTEMKNCCTCRLEPRSSQ